MGQKSFNILGGLSAERYLPLLGDSRDCTVLLKLTAKLNETYVHTHNYEF